MPEDKQEKKPTEDKAKTPEPSTSKKVLKAMGAAAGKIMSSEEMISGTLSTLSPKVLAEAFNENPEFYARLLGELSTEVISNTVNANPKFFEEIMTQLDPGVIARASSQNPDFIMGFMKNLDPVMIAEVMNNIPEFMITVTNALNPRNFAAVANGTIEWVSRLVGHLDRSLLADIIQRGADEGAFDGVSLVVSVEIPGLGSFESCTVRVTGARFEG